ncbi:MAG: TVP38/TMEM64 family protein, partial [Bacillota bacterium]
FDVRGTIEWLRHSRRHWWAPLVIVLAYVPGSLVMVPPRPLITIASVVAFGPWKAFVLAMVGVQIPSILSYYAGRAFDERTVERLAGPRLARVRHVLRHKGLMAFTALRLLPVAPFAVGSIVAGALRIPLADVIGGTFLGMLPGVLGATLLGREAAAAIDSGRWNWWAIGAVIGALAIFTLIGHRWLRKLQREAAPS